MKKKKYGLVSLIILAIFGLSAVAEDKIDKLETVGAATSDHASTADTLTNTVFLEKDIAVAGEINETRFSLKKEEFSDENELVAYIFDAFVLPFTKGRDFEKVGSINNKSIGATNKSIFAQLADTLKLNPISPAFADNEVNEIVVYNENEMLICRVKKTAGSRILCRKGTAQ